MVHQHLRCTSPARVSWPVLCTSISVRCRRCEGCKRLRQWAWTARSAHEQVFAKKTWFATLTYRPSDRSAIMQRASATWQESDGDPTKRLITASGSYVSNFCKTLRKRGFEFRYIFVPELHRNGFPHWHGLIFDQTGQLDWRQLTTAWSAGFSVMRLVRDANALRYVTKYLCKDNIGRVRASINFGSPGLVPPGEPPTYVDVVNGEG